MQLNLSGNIILIFEYPWLSFCYLWKVKFVFGVGTNANLDGQYKGCCFFGCFVLEYDWWQYEFLRYW